MQLCELLYRWLCFAEKPLRTGSEIFEGAIHSHTYQPTCSPLTHLGLWRVTYFRKDCSIRGQPVNSVEGEEGASLDCQKEDDVNNPFTKHYLSSIPLLPAYMSSPELSQPILTDRFSTGTVPVDGVLCRRVVRVSDFLRSRTTNLKVCGLISHSITSANWA